MSIKAIVISLPSSLERRAFQQHQLTQLGIPLEILRAKTPAELGTQTPNICFDSWERPLMPTEKACFFSHFAAWQMVIAEGKPILILEDDAILSSQMPRLLSCLEPIQHIEHLSLETRNRKKLVGDAMQLAPGLRLTRLIQDRTGAAAYVLWPRGARLLCEAAQKNGGALADAFISNSSNLKSYQMVPAMATQSDMADIYGICCDLNTSSYIQRNGSKAQFKARGLIGLKFKIRRLRAQITQARKFVGSIFIARRLMVPLDPNGFIFMKR